MRRALGLLIACLVASCVSDRPAPEKPSTPSATIVPAPAPDRPAPTPAPTPGDAVRSAATTVLEQWTSAQNKADLASYLALYDAKEFKGLKRTHNGKRKALDFAAWKKDRSAMFARGFEIAVEDVEVDSWLDADSTLKENIVRVRFLQRWRSKSYADHGPKTLLLWRNKDGALRIVLEELLLSRPGWDASSVEEDHELPALALAATVEEMAQALRVVPLPAYKVAIALDLDAFHDGLVLQAVFALGSPDCLSNITYEECGTPFEDWGSVAEATLEHPCGRRALLLDVLGSELPADALAAVAANFEEVFDAKRARPDPELGEAILKALPRQQHFALLARALRDPERRWNEAMRPFLMEQPTAALYALYEATWNSAVLEVLPLAEHAKRIAALHLSQKLPNELMLRVVATLAAQNQSALLAALVDASMDCELAMAAADALAKLGDGSKLPRWASAHDEARARRVICMLQSDPDEARASAELSRFFHPTHVVRSAQASASDDGIPNEEPVDEAAKRAYDEAVQLIKPPEDLGVEWFAGGIEALALGPHPKLLLELPFSGPQEPYDYSVLVLFEEGGHFYVDYLGRYQYEWKGCPC